MKTTSGLIVDRLSLEKKTLTVKIKKKSGVGDVSGRAEAVGRKKKTKKNDVTTPTTSRLFAAALARRRLRRAEGGRPKRPGLLRLFAVALVER